jgi:hypothetical protein
MEVISPSPLLKEDLDWTIERLRSLAVEGRTEELVRALRLSVGSRVATDEPEARRPRRMLDPERAPSESE